MKLHTLLLSFIIAVSSGLIAGKIDLEFVFLVSSYNNEKIVKRNLDSIAHQKTHAKYSIICVNDCSTDKTGQMMEEYAKEHNLPESFLKIINNKTRVGALENIYTTIHTHINDHQIVVICDGDDYIAHDRVLERLEKEYSDPNIWLTYGSFLFYPSGKWGTTYEISREVLEKKQVRTLTYVAQPLKTFKAALFKKIKKEDLMLDGKFYAMNSDMATMIPMIEMCAPLNANAPIHCKFIPDIMYLYKYDNPISDHRQGAARNAYQSELQYELANHINSLPPYDPLENLD